jgi:chaperonin GroES
MRSFIGVGSTRWESPLGWPVKRGCGLQSTAGGILLATTGTESLDEAQFGVVLAVGEDVEAGVKVGDTILFQKYSTSEVSVPDGKVVFVAEKSILATLG